MKSTHRIAVLFTALSMVAGGAAYAQKPAQPPKPQVKAAVGDAEQKKLKEEQDRKAKAMSTLSNTMKKQAETQSTVTGNLK